MSKIRETITLHNIYYIIIKCEGLLRKHYYVKYIIVFYLYLKHDNTLNL